MTNSRRAVASLGNQELLTRTRVLVGASCRIEADILLHLGEVDERKLYLERSFPSMFAFCVDELGFSEDAAYNRIVVARAARRLPRMIEAIRSGRVHLYGLRLLAPHLTEENHARVLAEAAGMSKREIELLVARLSPRPPAPTVVRRLPNPLPSMPAPMPARAVVPPSTEDLVSPAVSRAGRHRPAVAPLTAETFKIQFTADQEFHDKLRRAQDLLRHRVPDGNLAKVLGAALDALIGNVTKERFAVGRKPRSSPAKDPAKPPSRHIPDRIKRAVFERDGGRCTFVGKDGRRCAETGALEFDHIDGFARAPVHAADRIRLLCRAHNQHAADRMYGREFMDRARVPRTSPSTRSGTSSTDRDSSPEAQSGADIVARPTATRSQFAYG